MKHFDFRQKTAKAPVRHTTSAVTASGVIYSMYAFQRSLVSPIAKPLLEYGALLRALNSRTMTPTVPVPPRRK